MKTITIKGQLRSESGKKASRRLRSEGKVPAVIYGGKENLHFYTEPSEIKPIVYTGEFMLANIEVEGKQYRCILKDMQFDKISDKVIHLDFLELNDNRLVRADIPLKFVGQSKGVKDGGRFVVKMTALKVRTLPSNLVEFIEVDITKLKIGDNIRIGDIQLENMEIMQSVRIPVAGVVTTRVLKQAANAGVVAEEETEEEEATENAEA